ncbi:hypothetical protein [Parafrankia sp. BMG5.11]|uniref:hypothetical protein n=1 Tax=Parafrankia sp. BMG5.11 TaxID=222540 RepID=UPI001039DA11|nr:hypothetical protein [Parafrankia sp. BMG5.11]TCJ41285.1 hypothetical protein E0504_01345 [Parafrankia sp. BMG5.11]
MNEGIERADARLKEAFRRINYNLGTNASVIDHTEVRDRQNRYLFAWHRHKNHLLFYLRREALDARTTLRQSAIGQHGLEAVRQNNGRETLITLTSEQDAEKLVDWLIPKLPLP